MVLELGMKRLRTAVSSEAKTRVKVECWGVGVKKANQLSWEVAGEGQRGKQRKKVGRRKGRK